MALYVPPGLQYSLALIGRQLSPKKVQGKAMVEPVPVEMHLMFY